MGAIDTTYTFQANDTITSTKMNNIIDQTTIMDAAIVGETLQVVAGQLKVRAQGITSNELAASAVNTIAIEAGAVTSAKLNSSVIFVPAGAVMAFAMNSAPTGWLACNGAIVSRTTYAALFAAIGGTWGVDSANFALPDLRGYFVRGVGTNSDGTASGEFGSKQTDSLASHTHAVTAGQASGTSSGCGNGVAFQRAGDSNCGTSTTSATGSTETRPKNIAMLYCIKY
jgi:microcystin-dependent protein